MPPVKCYADRLVEEPKGRGPVPSADHELWSLLDAAGRVCHILRDGKDRQKEKANQSEKKKKRLLEARLRLTHYRLPGSGWP